MKSYKIAHCLASCAVASRRKAEELVLQGLVKVNGKKIFNVAERVTETDKVYLNDQLITLITQPKLYGYYKPVMTLVSHAYDPDKQNIFELVEERVGHVLSVGRLDYMSEGLILLTDSNQVCSELMHSDLPRTYKILIDQEFTVGMKMYVSDDFIINDVVYQPRKMERCYETAAGYWLTVTLYEGKNREIRNVLQFFDLNIKRLIRVQYGDYRLQGSPDELHQIY